jgi:hypothetical protein
MGRAANAITAARSKPASFLNLFFFITFCPFLVCICIYKKAVLRVRTALGFYIQLAFRKRKRALIFQSS